MYSEIQTEKFNPMDYNISESEGYFIIGFFLFAIIIFWYLIIKCILDSLKH